MQSSQLLMMPFVCIHTYVYIRIGKFLLKTGIRLKLKQLRCCILRLKSLRILLYMSSLYIRLVWTSSFFSIAFTFARTDLCILNQTVYAATTFYYVNLMNKWKRLMKLMLLISLKIAHSLIMINVQYYLIT